MTGWLRRNADQAGDYANAVAGASALAGGLAGGAAAVYTGGAAVLVPLAIEWAKRQLSKSQRARVDLVLTLAAQKINDAIADGEQLRTDGFFDELPDGRRPGQEAAEGVTTVARDSYEERKLPFLAHLLTAISVNDQIGPEFANRLIRLSDELSWTQYVLLAGIEKRDSIEPPDVRIGHSARSWSSWSVSNELRDLWWERGLTIAPSAHTPGGLPFPNSALRHHRLSNGGGAIYHFLGLDDIGSLEINRVWRLLVLDDTPEQDQDDERNVG